MPRRTSIRPDPMSDTDLNTKIAQMQQLFSRRMRAKGTLEQQIQRRAKRLPRKLRADARKIAKVVPMLEHPKLSRQINHAGLKAAADRVNSHLKQVDPRDRPWVKVVQVLSWVLLAIVVAWFAVQMLAIWVPEVRDFVGNAFKLDFFLPFRVLGLISKIPFAFL